MGTMARTGEVQDGNRYERLLGVNIRREYDDYEAMVRHMRGDGTFV